MLQLLSRVGSHFCRGILPTHARIRSELALVNGKKLQGRSGCDSLWRNAAKMRVMTSANSLQYMAPSAEKSASVHMALNFKKTIKNQSPAQSTPHDVHKGADQRQSKRRHHNAAATGHGRQTDIFLPTTSSPQMDRAALRLQIQRQLPVQPAVELPRDLADCDVSHILLDIMARALRQNIVKKIKGAQDMKGIQMTCCSSINSMSCCTYPLQLWLAGMSGTSNMRPAGL